MCKVKFMLFFALVWCLIGDFTNTAQTTKCPEGTYLHQRDDTSTCPECPPGTFMPWKSHTADKCFDCTKVENQTVEILISPCDRFHEADVQCVEGYYRRLARNPGDKPTCLTCRPACPEHDYEVHPCQNFSDRGCCPGENYDYVVGDGDIRMCRERPFVCRRGQYLHSPSTSNDCRPCPENTFMAEDYHSYTRCWDCPYLSDAHLPLYAVITQPCTTSQSPRYGCIHGYYMNHGMSNIGDDIHCSRCQTCDKGKYVGKQCDMYHDTVCCDKPNMAVVDGPQGAQCVEKIDCKDGSYNPPACDKTCSQHCRVNERSDVSQCDNDNGTCLFGCLEGYTGSTCEVPQHKRTEVDASTISVVILVLVVIVMVICVVYNKHCPRSGPKWWQRLARYIFGSDTAAGADVKLRDALLKERVNTVNMEDETSDAEGEDVSQNETSDAEGEDAKYVKLRAKGGRKEDKTQASKYKGRLSRLEQDKKLKDNIIKKLKNDIEQKDKTYKSYNAKLQAENERLRRENSQLSAQHSAHGVACSSSDDSGVEGEGEIIEVEPIISDDKLTDKNKNVDVTNDEHHYKMRNCKKHATHEDFIPVNKFHLHHLPESHRDQMYLDCIMAVASLTVRLVLSHVSCGRPENYLFSAYRGKHVRAFASGKVIRILRRFISMVGESCPCPQCEELPQKDRKQQWGEFLIATARYVVYNEEEARHTQVDIDYNTYTDRDTCPKLHGLSVRYFNINEDLSLMSCVTHDRDVALMLEERVRRYDDPRTKLENKYSSLRPTDSKSVVIVSHPHGMSKHISVGEWKGQQEEKPYKWRYTTSACNGSGGAPVCVLGDLQGRYLSVSTHSGDSKDHKLNQSGSDGLFL